VGESSLNDSLSALKVASGVVLAVRIDRTRYLGERKNDFYMG